MRSVSETWVYFWVVERRAGPGRSWKARRPAPPASRGGGQGWGEAGVAEEFLDGAQVGAIGQQVGGVGVAEAVGVHGGVAGEVGGVEFDDATDAARRETGMAVVEEDGGLLAHHGTLAEVALQRLGGFTGKRHLALLLAFTADAEPAGGAVDVLEVEACQFADADAATVEQLEESAVARGEGALEFAGGDAIERSEEHTSEL